MVLFEFAKEEGNEKSVENEGYMFSVSVSGNRSGGRASRGIDMIRGSSSPFTSFAR